MRRTSLNRLKRIVKSVVCPAFFYMGVYDRQIERFHKNKVLIYWGHRVSGGISEREKGVAPLNFEVGVTQERFEAQMRFLREKMQPVSLQEIVDFVTGRKQVKERAVSVMFDDGYMDNYLNAFPVLKRYAIPATIFLTTGYINSNSTFWWDRVGEILKRTPRAYVKLQDIRNLLNGDGNRVPDIIYLNSQDRKNEAWELLTKLLRRCKPDHVKEAIDFLEQQLEVESEASSHLHRLLRWDQVREMSRNGIDFGAHTVTHPLLSHVSQSEFRNQILSSKMTIEEHIGRPVTSFAYPYGDVPKATADVAEKLRHFGFQCAFLVEQGYISPYCDRFALKRIGIGNVPVSLMFRELAVVLNDHND